MSVKILINNSEDPKTDYITWAKSKCKIISDENVPYNVILSNKSITNGGQIVFMKNENDLPSEVINIVIPANGSVNFYIAGKFDLVTGKSYPSNQDKDTSIVVKGINDNTIIEKSLMVRVRKNANKLTIKERDAFLDSIVKLNQSGQYIELQNMHLEDNSNEIHGRSCFLPWHRAFLLDLERKLQEINPSITIPYWKFDEKAPTVFTPDFLGIPDSTGMVEFSNTNPMVNWKLRLFGLGNGTRIRRGYFGQWNPINQRAFLIRNNDSQTIAVGSKYNEFIAIEGDPHGMAHISFEGQLSDIGKAPADPLFFLLHCNIDRLWAKWQWINNRYDNNTNSYPNLGNTPNPNRSGELGIGNFTNDTMWPWNNISDSPRPLRAPSTGFPTTSLTNFPGSQPTVGNMIDFQGQNNDANNLYFAYDDVPFESSNPTI